MSKTIVLRPGLHLMFRKIWIKIEKKFPRKEKNVERRLRELEYSFNHHGHCPSCQELVVIPEIGYVRHECFGGFFYHNVFIKSRIKNVEK